MIALFVLAASGVNLLYGRGDFGFETTRQTILCLWGYGIGLLPSVFVLLLAPAFYAQKKFKGPMKAAVLSVLLNVFLNALFVFGFHWGAFSIALSTSLSAWVNYFLLLKALDVKTRFDRAMYQVAFCSLIAGVVTFLLAHFLAGDPTLSLLLGKEGQASLEFSRGFGLQLLHFFVLVGIFGLSFLSYAWHFGIQEILTFLKLPIKQKSSFF
jgi:putative peptidoglycan lipid II flippase